MKRSIKILTVWLAAALCVAALIPAVRADDGWDPLLGTVSAQYESNGDPGTVSGGAGDLGGASYGAYQFAGNFGVPRAFANWCVSSGAGPEVGNRLLAAYAADGNTFGNTFNAQWKALAKEDADGFLSLQRQYIGTQFYQPAAEALQTYLGLNIDDYGIAFKNAIWSRSVQHGVGSFTNRTGFLGIMRKVSESIAGGVFSVDEADLITAIYEESGAVSGTGTNPMRAATAGGNAWIIRQYDLEGKYMTYYSGNSSAVQAGVYLRLRVKELNDLLTMCETYGGYRATAQSGGSATPYLRGSQLVLSDCDSLQGWTGDADGMMTVSSTHRQQGRGGLLLLPFKKTQTNPLTAAADLCLSLPVDLTGASDLAVWVYLPAKLTGDAAFTVTWRLDDTAKAQTAVSLAGRQAGWQALTVALPATADLRQINALSVGLTHLPDACAGQPFVLDDLRALLSPDDLQTATVKADALNCRAGPSTRYESLGMFLQNTVVTVLGQGANGWYLCSGAGQNGGILLGWCSGDYLTAFKPGATFDHLRYDVNEDGAVNASDALLVLRYNVGKIVLTARQQQIANANGDDRIDASDALVILRAAVGKST